MIMIGPNIIKLNRKLGVSNESNAIPNEAKVVVMMKYFLKFNFRTPSDQHLINFIWYGHV